MPNSNFISDLLEIKDLIVENIKTTAEEVNIFFKLERHDHVCPICGAVTNKVHDYRTSIINDTLEIMLSLSPDLAQAYYLKEQFYAFMKSSSRQEALPKLKKFILAAEVSELSEFNACLTMLANWSKYILNAFDCAYSNGFTEGTNNKIKVIKRNAYGYRNLENFRNRILLTTT